MHLNHIFNLTSIPESFCQIGYHIRWPTTCSNDTVSAQNLCNAFSRKCLESLVSFFRVRFLFRPWMMLHHQWWNYLPDFIPTYNLAISKKKKKKPIFQKMTICYSSGHSHVFKIISKRNYKVLHLRVHSQGDYFEGGTTHLDELVLAY